MMYFSRIRFEQDTMSSKDLFRVLQSNAYSMHQLIWKLFPEDPDAKRDFLFRQEFEKEQLSSSESRRGLPIFYMVSERKPLSVEGLFSVETKHYDPKLSIGTMLSFETRVNPVIQEKVERENIEDWINARKQRGLSDKSPTKLRRYHDVIMDAKKKAKDEGIVDTATISQRTTDATLNWLSDIGKKYGFDLLDQSRVEVSGYRQEVLRKRGNKEIKFSSVDLSGTLIVTNPELFRSILFSGIGHSRSFGCGMFMIRRV